MEEVTYDHKKIESKWNEHWAKDKVYEPDVDKAKTPFYNLMMFPYPSAEGLHVGNVYAFVGADIYGRFMRMNTKDVFEPIGLDGFGIHSENYALKINQHPAVVTKRTEANFYRQLHLIGNGFAWSSKLETYDPGYYKWTQWIFTQLFKAGLAYRAKAKLNWCPGCKTVLSDEQVIKRSKVKGQRSKMEEEIFVCERCVTEVVERELTQWFFKITAYAQKLLDGLEVIDWSEKVKLAQVNWLGKSKGVTLRFASDIDSITRIEVFTTRPDTVFGVTYVALAPEHPLVLKIIDQSKGLLRQQIQDYVDKAIHNRKKTRNIKLRVEIEKVKTGVKTSFHAINPLSGEKVPIFIADYVLTEYGSGAVMGVPAHDQRDWDFAKKYHLDMVEVVSGDDISRKAFTGAGTIVNSGKFNGLSSEEAIGKISDEIAKAGSGEARIMWHLRDWIISRQRYWGPPIPMIYCEVCRKAGKSWFTTVEAESWRKGMGISNGPLDSKLAQGEQFQMSNKSKKIRNYKIEIKNSGHEMLGWPASNASRSDAGWYPVPDEELPVELPYIENFKPTGTGVSPLATDPKFVNVKCPACGSNAKRETDVSDTFLDSAWYFLRYPSVRSNAKGPVAGSSNPTLRQAQGKRQGSQFIPSETEGLDGTPSASATPYCKELDIGHWTLDIPWNREITRRWLPVDMYIGGAEHSVLHLLYARFLTKVFYDLGLVNFDEPFTKFRAHGLLIKDGAKMSKSKGNVVTPDEYIEKYGADTLRSYLMFCGRFEQGGDFRDSGIGGMSKFLRRVWRLVTSTKGSKSTRGTTGNKKALDTLDTPTSRDTLRIMHKTIKKVTADIQNLDYNTAISAIMEWVNALEAREQFTVNPSTEFGASSSQLTVKSKKQRTMNREPITREEIENLLKLLAPFAPYMTEELWSRIAPTSPRGLRPRSRGARIRDKESADQNTNSIHLADWPKHREELARQDKVVLVVQVNGKVRDRIEVERGLSQADATQLVLKSKNVSKFLGGKAAEKVVYVPDRIINVVV